MLTETTFTVSGFTPVPVDAVQAPTALGVGVATMEKLYSGGAEGRSTTLFTSAFDPERGVGTYVAIESFVGSLDGRTGAFNFAHAATTRGAGRSAEYFTIVPGSGTGDLAGIEGGGSLVIEADGTHRVTFDYTLR
ncbi:DUF3224 domain-containing protein [Cellulomonas sp. JH27-2]|uniref:DUF3224 domain-containing protein n=1 Tax=Cellulomonas sp. JH27-2 TaxID=2774139 RepID=UPI001784BE89|nr:DUF3224 domain-containing protein [Cellulomonas sp. JH27-2]MBD8059893.1 DUF3224 domain-containing protein [Cellulomonas sp. JH27-2]